MNDIEKRARGLLAIACETADLGRCAEYLRSEEPLLTDDQIAVNAIIAALTPPEGYVLVPVEPTEEMLIAGYGWQSAGAYLEESWKAMVDARPEIKS